MPKVLFVCAGNICRSPMAEGIYRALLAERGLEAQVDSCGTGNWHQGQAAHPRTQTILKQYGSDFAHAARQIAQSDFEQFDYIFAMDRANLHDLKRMFPQQHAKARLMLEDAEVPDPYYGEMADYEQVYALLYPALRKLVDGWYPSADDSKP